MPPLQSNPEIIHAKPNSDEFTHCIEQLQAGETWVTVINNGDLPAKYFFTAAEPDPSFAGVSGRVATAAIVDGLVHFPPFFHARTFRTYEQYAEAMDRDNDNPSRIVEGEVESVVINSIEPITPAPRGRGRFFGLGRPRKTD